MEETTIYTIEAYLNLIKKKQAEKLHEIKNLELLFRGQHGDYPLLPKLARLKPKGELLTTEQQILYEFKRTNPLLIAQHHPLDDWDYLTLGQHFGMPTRLLDWSKNALTALWFACDAQNERRDVNDEYCVVWILLATEKDFINETKFIEPFDVPQTKIVRPRIIKQRINNQSGVFTVTCSKDLTGQKSMADLESYKDRLIKVKIPTGKIEMIKMDLDTLGINSFSIFPELEGLCSFLQWRYFEA